MIDIGSIVFLYDYNEEKEVCYKIVPTCFTYRFNGRDFDSNEYKFKVVQELKEGGNGLDSISLESELGKVLYKKKVGDIVSFLNRIGKTERFKVISIK